MTALSGGQAARAGLASLLLSRYDVFLLDEPTNDLDLAGLDRLERFVDGPARRHRAGQPRPRVPRPHRRPACVELDLAQQQVTVFGGGYDAYLEERDGRAPARPRGRTRSTPTRSAGLEARARTQRAWMEKGVRNARRKATDNDKHRPQVPRRGDARSRRPRPRQTERLIERLDVVEEPRKEWQLQMEIAAAPRAGAVVATAARRRRAARRLHASGRSTCSSTGPTGSPITGPNGVGQVDAARRAARPAAARRRAPPRSGPASSSARSTRPRRCSTATSRCCDAFGARCRTGRRPTSARCWPSSACGADHVLRPAATLSPGERTRAALALLQARGVNLLVLDEPTNHLDLPAIEQLEQALDSFAGTLLLVTHDRRMLEAVRLTRRLHVDAGRVTEVAA